MKTPFIGMLIVVLFFSACGDQKEQEIRAYLEEAFYLFHKKEENAAAIAELLTKGLTAYPDSIPLLQSRANLYCSLGMSSECREDILRLLALKPDLAEARMMLCLLDEFEGTDEQNSKACYQEAAEMFAARSPASSPEVKIGNECNYVFALLMARHPDAEKEKSAFLSRIEPESTGWMYHEMLHDFDRERALREVFGQ